MLRRALSVFLACAMVWLPLLSVAGLACGGDDVQPEIHSHPEPSGTAPDQSHHIHVCHSICASCAVFSTSIPVVQFATTHKFNNNITAKVPSLDLPVQERPPRLI